MTATTRPLAPPEGREGPPVAELFVGFFRRDLQGFFPQCRFEQLSGLPAGKTLTRGPEFRLIAGTSAEPAACDAVEIFGVRYAIAHRGGKRFSDRERRLIRAIGSVLSLRYQQTLRMGSSPRLDLFRGGAEDHYIAAFVEPESYAESSERASRTAATIHTLRMAALSTYENRRVTAGALLLGDGDDPNHPPTPTPVDALTYGVELTALKSIHRLCDGERTVFLIDSQGKLAATIDIARWVGPMASGFESP
jgi:hypothetical protein